MNSSLIITYCTIDIIYLDDNLDYTNIVVDIWSMPRLCILQWSMTDEISIPKLANPDCFINKEMVKNS